MFEIQRDTDARRSARDARRARLQLVAPETLAAGPSTAPAPVPMPVWVRRYRARLTVSDSLLIVVAIIAAYFTRFWWGGSLLQADQVAATHWMTSVIIVTVWIAMLAVYRSRDPRVVGVGAAEYRRVLDASFLTFGLVAIALVVLKIDVSRGFFVLTLPIGLGGLILSRWLWRNWLVSQRAAGRYRSRAIVVGDRVDVKFVIGQIDKRGRSAYEVVGVALDDVNGGPVDVNSRGHDVVASLFTVAHAASELRVDTVIVAGQPAGGGHFIRDLAWDLEGTAAELVVASRLTNIAGPRIHLRPVDGLPLMHVELPQFEGGKHVLKRGVDVALSAAAMLFLAPVFVVLAYLVHRDSDGPVLFRQERVGRGGKTFHMLKCRSMVATAETDLAGLLDKNEGAGVLFKMKNDPRITRIGKVLRKYSLDELPQLWNIFIGDMSIVGPRPPLQSEVADYDDRVHRRLYIKPGLTGMWQVNGRSNLDWDESVRLDLYYVENWSLAGDLFIMWRTLRVLKSASGAY